MGALAGWLRLRGTVRGGYPGGLGGPRPSQAPHLLCWTAKGCSQRASLVSLTMSMADLRLSQSPPSPHFHLHYFLMDLPASTPFPPYSLQSLITSTGAMIAMAMNGLSPEAALQRWGLQSCRGDRGADARLEPPGMSLPAQAPHLLCVLRCAIGTISAEGAKK